MQNQLCLCQSGKLFKKCCEPFISQTRTAKTVKQLMRSRFCAYALGGYGDYLMNTWHPDYRAGIHAATLSAKTQNWLGLTIVDSQQQADQGSVEFKATFENETGGVATHHELSSFLRERGIWYYTVGEIMEQE